MSYSREEIKSEIARQPIQRKGSSFEKKSSKFGLPDQLKSGIENLSGHSMDDVKVHYNSSKPAQLNAHAYAKGSDIHLGPSQEKHLPHEAWHVVQQKQGRVKATTQFNGVGINDDVGLEQEADVMGAKALSKGRNLSSSPARYESAQLKCAGCEDEEEDESGATATSQLASIVQRVTECESSDHYNDAYHRLMVRLYDKKFGDAGEEYAVRNGGSWNYVDLVDTHSKEVYEIKSNSDTAADTANTEAKMYKSLLNSRCGGGWTLGDKFPDIVKDGNGETITFSTPKKGAIVYDIVERDLSDSE